MLFGSAEREVPPTVPVVHQADDETLAPLPQTPPPSDEEAADVRELRRDVASLSQQLAAALTMLNTLSVSAATTTEAAQSTAAAAAVAAAAAQNVAPAPAPTPAQPQYAPLILLSVPAVAEAESDQSNAAAAAATVVQSNVQRNTKSRLFDYASQKMLRMLKLEKSDPLLHSTTVKRFTPNCTALYGWGKTQIPTIFDAFERNTIRPGHTALQALKDF